MPRFRLPNIANKAKKKEAINPSPDGYQNRIFDTPKVLLSIKERDTKK